MLSHPAHEMKTANAICWACWLGSQCWAPTANYYLIISVTLIYIIQYNVPMLLPMPEINIFLLFDVFPYYRYLFSCLVSRICLPVKTVWWNHGNQVIILYQSVKLYTLPFQVSITQFAHFLHSLIPFS